MTDPMRSRCAALAFGLLVAGPAVAADHQVRTTRDAGPGSLRQAIVDANRAPGPDVIRFDSVKGPFGEPRTIMLESDLPPITDALEIDGFIEDRLWVPNGVTIDGAGRFQVFRVAPGVAFRLRYLTVAHGRAVEGGGLASEGQTRVENMRFTGNGAEVGGAIAQRDGRLWLVNSTLDDNHAERAGGGLSASGGETVVTNSTLTANRAPLGAGLHNTAKLKMANTILAGNLDGADCESTQALDDRSTHNLVRRAAGCGTAKFTDDPRLGAAGVYNGPTASIPLEGGSPIVNQGDNASAVDPDGLPFAWDQRGNGDPRFAAGITDIGAFEQQAVTVLQVDLADDVDVRGCSPAPTDCSLRGALTLAGAASKPATVTFDRKVFAEHPAITLSAPLPPITRDILLDAGKDLAVHVVTPGGAWPTVGQARVEARGVTLSTPSAP